MSHDEQVREGEITLPVDPADMALLADTPRCVFIGHIETPWKTRADCPRNLQQARRRMKEMGRTATLHIDEPFRPGLLRLEDHSHIIVGYWMHQAARHIIVQRPRHMPGPRGVFSLRSPVRPNPVALSTVRLLEVNHDAGTVRIDAIDCISGTPLFDLRPWVADIDLPEDWCERSRHEENHEDPDA